MEAKACNENEGKRENSGKLDSGPKREAEGKGEDEVKRELSRAAVYGLTPDDLLDHALVIPPGAHVLLQNETSKASKSERGFVRLQPKTLDDVKRWIGVPDELGAKRLCCCHPSGEIPDVGSVSDFRNLHPSVRRSVNDLAKEYVHGDSRRVSAYKPILDHLVDRAYIHGVFLRQDIDIHKGSVLEIGKTVKILFARHIRIFVGGQLKISGDAKIDCVSIKGNVSNLSISTLLEKPIIGRVLN